MASHCSSALSPSHRDLHYCSQMQSPFFRKIPAEIRLDIYSFYAFEKDGYFHSPSTGKLSLSGVEDSAEFSPIKLDLMYTCKAINQEMRGVALRINKVTFLTGDYHADSNFYEDLQSKAARSKLLLSRLAITRRQMLLWAEDCVTTSMLNQVIANFGHEGQYLADAFRGVKEGRDGVNPRDRLLHDGANLLGQWITDFDVDPPVKFQQALQSLLLLASNHADFQDLARRAFDPSANASRNWTTLFESRAYAQVLNWTITPWKILSDTDLATWENLFLEVNDTGPLLTLEVEDCVMPYKWYFSAAAMAIDFIDRHQLGSQLRNVELVEDHVSVSNPECHARGLVSLCIKNPMLRIKRNVRILSGLFPRGWGFLPTYVPQDDSLVDREDYLDNPMDVPPEWLLLALVPWLDEANGLPAELPPKSLELKFDGVPDDTLITFNLIKEAAKLQDAHLEYYRRRDMVPPPPRQSVSFQEKAYPLPCHLPIGFLQVVKDIILGNRSDLWFIGSASKTEMWNLDEIMNERENWTSRDWENEWQDFMSKRIGLLEEGLLSRLSVYLIDSGEWY